MFAISHLQTLSQQVGHRVLILNFVRPEPHQVQNLLIGQYLCWWCFFLFLVLFFSHYLNYIQLFINSLSCLFCIFIQPFLMTLYIFSAISQNLISNQYNKKAKIMQVSFKRSPQLDNSPQLENGRLQIRESYETPEKNSEQTAQKTLMKSILQRISSSKQNSQSSKNKKFESRKQNMANLQKQNSAEQTSQQKEIILRNQSVSNPGFYQFSDWVKIHAQFFAYVGKRYSEQLWKILRLINYGQVLIPTGIVFQIFNSIRKNNNKIQFQQLINNFLKENDAPDCCRSFKQLKNYTSISEIQKIYKGIESQQQNKNKNQISFKSKQRSQSATNVFQRNFIQAKKRTQKKIEKIYQNLLEEEKLLQQKPKISVYRSQSYKSLIKPERICHKPHEHKWQDEQQRYLKQNAPIQALFKAKKLDKSIFEGNIQQIPGVVSHLSRNQYCHAEKLKAKREAQRPQYSKKKIF